MCQKKWSGHSAMELAAVIVDMVKFGIKSSFEESDQHACSLLCPPLIYSFYNYIQATSSAQARRFKYRRWNLVDMHCHQARYLRFEQPPHHVYARFGPVLAFTLLTLCRHVG
jgi:hypothetical protein